MAGFDLLRFVLTSIIDRERLETWVGERIADLLPRQDLPTPTDDVEFTHPLCALPMRTLAQGARGIFAWMLMDGTILSKEGQEPLAGWRPGDDGRPNLLERTGVEMSRRPILVP